MIQKEIIQFDTVKETLDFLNSENFFNGKMSHPMTGDFHDFILTVDTWRLEYLKSENIKVLNIHNCAFFVSISDNVSIPELEAMNLKVKETDFIKPSIHNYAICNSKIVTDTPIYNHYYFKASDFYDLSKHYSTSSKRDKRVRNMARKLLADNSIYQIKTYRFDNTDNQAIKDVKALYKGWRAIMVEKEKYFHGFHKIFSFFNKDIIKDCPLYLSILYKQDTPVAANIFVLFNDKVGLQLHYLHDYDYSDEDNLNYFFMVKAIKDNNLADFDNLMIYSDWGDVFESGADLSSDAYFDTYLLDKFKGKYHRLSYDTFYVPYLNTDKTIKSIF